jgi:hypothetical protein
MANAPSDNDTVTRYAAIPSLMRSDMGGNVFGLARFFADEKFQVNLTGKTMQPALDESVNVWI